MDKMKRKKFKKTKARIELLLKAIAAIGALLVGIANMIQAFK